MSKMPSENMEAENNKTNTRQELINMVLCQANEISHALYNFKVKSREIHTKIQNHINSIKLYTDLCLPKRDSSLENFHKAVNDLHLELKQIAYVTSELRKLSNSEDPLPNNTESIRKETSNKLKALTNALFYKTLHIKWCSAWLKTKRLKQKAIADLFNTILQEETCVEPSPVKHKHGSLPKQTPSLSDVISEMNTMIQKLSFKSDDEVPASKPQTFAPTSESEVKNIHNETGRPVNVPPSNPRVYVFRAKPTSGTQKIHRASKVSSKPQINLQKNPMTNIFEAKPTSNSVNSPKPTEASQQSLKCDPPLFKAFESKPESINKGTSNSQAKGPLSNPRVYLFEAKSTISETTQASQDEPSKLETPSRPHTYQSNPRVYLFGAEPKISDVSAPTKATQESLKSELPLFEVFKSKPLNMNKDTSKPQVNGEPSNPRVYIFGAESTISDVSTPEPASKEPSSKEPPFSKAFEWKPTNMNNGTSKAQAFGFLSTPRVYLFSAKPTISDGVGTSRVKFIAPTYIAVRPGDAPVRYQCITFIEEFENKSLEELRFEDYVAGRRGHILNIFKSQSESSTATTNTPTQSRESPTQAPTQNRKIPTQNCETTTQQRETQFREATTQFREVPTQKTETSTQNCETTTQNRATKSIPDLRVSDEDATALERLLEDGKTEKAIKMCNDALVLDPENVFFLVHRARAHYELKQYREALEDSQKAVSLSPNLPAIGYLSIAKCCLALGQVALGEQAVRRAVEREPSVEVEELREAFTSLRSKQERVHRFISQHKYYDAVYVIDHCLQRHCPASSMMKLMKAECLAHMRKYEEARNIVIDLSLSCMNVQSSGTVYADAMYVNGLCSYYQENDELATKHFRKVLEHDPDHEKAIKMYKLTKTRIKTNLIKQKKELGNKAFNVGNWRKALDFYDEALSIDKNNKEENAKLHYNRATVFAKLDQPKNAIHACTAALELDGNYIKALLRRAQCYKDIEMYEESLDDYEQLYYIDSTEENKRLMDEANRALLANEGRYYYYKVLGINKTATQDDIKKAYKKCALRYHPDKHASASLSEMRKNERKFKLMKEAYELLSDPVKRANYDRNRRRNYSSSDEYENGYYGYY